MHDFKLQLWRSPCSLYEFAQRTVGTWLLRESHAGSAQSSSPSRRFGGLEHASRSLGGRSSLRQHDILAILEVTCSICLPLMLS